MRVNGKRSAVYAVVAVQLLVSATVARGHVGLGSQERRPSAPATSRVRLVPQIGHSYLVKSVAFSPDGATLLTGSHDHTVRLWEASSGALLRSFEGMSAVFSPDGTKVLTGSFDYMAKLWDARTGAPLRTFEGKPDDAPPVAFSPDGTRVVSGHAGHVAMMWDAETGALVRTLEGHSRGVNSIAFSPDGARMVTGSSDGTARLWDAHSGALLRAFEGLGGVTSVAISPDGAMILAGASDKLARLCDASTGARLKDFEGHGEAVNAVAFSPDGTRVLTGSGDSTARLWDVRSGTVLATLAGHSGIVFGVAFSRDGAKVLTGGSDETARLWDAATGAAIRTVGGHASSVNAVAFSPDGTRILAGSDDNRGQLWDVRPGTLVRTLEGHSDGVHAVAFSPDGATLATGSSDTTVRLWDADSGAARRTLTGHTGLVASVAFSPDGATVLTGCSDETARLWEARSGAPVRTLKAHTFWTYSAAFSPDGARVLTAGGDRTARLWDARSGALLRTFEGHTGLVTSAAFSLDGARIVTGSLDTTARLWDAGSGALLRTLEGHAYPVLSAAFSPDGTMVLTGSFDTTARLWDAASGALVETLTGNTGGVNAVAFSPDGRYAITGGYDATVRVWNAAAGVELCSLIAFADGTWTVVAPDGRFDTNNLEEIRGLHWVADDDPFTALPVEVFMRDYYEPGLLRRLFEGQRFAPVRDLGSRNRVQPLVRILDVEPDGSSPDRVTVRVEVSRGSRRYAQGGSVVTRSTDVYDVRLFRDGALVASAPAAGATGPAADLLAWRAANRVEVDAATGRAILTFERIRLPLSRGAPSVELSAYAFNEDRVKSATYRRTFSLSAGAAARRGRAYIVAVGVNAFDDPSLNLRFAVNDAVRIQSNLRDRLLRTGAFDEVAAIPLVSDASGERAATKANVKAVLDALAGRPVDSDALAAVPGAEALRPATPDDLVLIAFASHGYSDGRGNFYLLPSDIGAGAREKIAAVGDGRGLELASSGAASEESILSRCISSDELALWFRDVDAGQTVMIIDACQAAAFTGEDFKPGPMGSRGLGQLAYDKSMLILAATQADNVALESGRFQHGLATYALVSEGLEKGKADWKPADGTTWLSEWLAYAVDRVPRLVEELGTGRARTVEKVQRPALFDFTRGRHAVAIQAHQNRAR